MIDWRCLPARFALRATSLHPSTGVVRATLEASPCICGHWGALFPMLLWSFQSTSKAGWLQSCSGCEYDQSAGPTANALRTWRQPWAIAHVFGRLRLQAAPDTATRARAGPESLSTDYQGVGRRVSFANGQTVLTGGVCTRSGWTFCPYDLCCTCVLPRARKRNSPCMLTASLLVRSIRQLRNENGRSWHGAPRDDA